MRKGSAFLGSASDWKSSRLLNSWDRWHLTRFPWFQDFQGALDQISQEWPRIKGFSVSNAPIDLSEILRHKRTTWTSWTKSFIQMIQEIQEAKFTEVRVDLDSWPLTSIYTTAVRSQTDFFRTLLPVGKLQICNSNGIIPGKPFQTIEAMISVFILHQVKKC